MSTLGRSARVQQLTNEFRDRSKASGSRSVWAEEEEDELQRLYEEFKDAHDPGE